MRKKYTLVLEVDLEDTDEQNAIQVARSHYRQAGPGSTPVNWNARIWKWRRITAEEFIPDVEVAIMELIDANALLDEAGIEVTSVSCGEVKSGITGLSARCESGPKHLPRSGLAEGKRRVGALAKNPPERPVD